MPTHTHHAAARAWLTSVTVPASIAFSRMTQQSMLRLLSGGAVSSSGHGPLTNREAWRAFEAVSADHRIVMLETEPPGLEAVWKRFTERGTASPKLWMEGYLAAFAVAGGHRFVTFDRAFTQFADLDLLLLP